MRRRLLPFVLALLAGCASGPEPAPGPTPTPQAQSDEDLSGYTILVALAGPFTGPAAAFGESLRKAAALQVEQVNDAGGIRGGTLDLVVEDDRGTPMGALRVSERLARDPSVAAVVGHFNSAASNAAKAAYAREGVVALSPGSTNNLVCRGNPWIFRNLYRDDYQGTCLARYASGVLGAKTLAVLYDKDDYGAGLAHAFADEAEKQGAVLAARLGYMRGRTTDFVGLVKQLKGAKVDVVFVAGLYYEASLIAKAVREVLGEGPQLLGGDGLMHEMFMKSGGAATEGALISTPFLFEAASDPERAAAFVEAYKARFGRSPDVWAAYSYDAVGMLAEAIRAVGTDRWKIRDWLASRTSAATAYKGVTGLTYFDGDGDCYSKPVHVAVVKNGRFVAAERQLPPE